MISHVIRNISFEYLVLIVILIGIQLVIDISIIAYAVYRLFTRRDK